MRAPAERNINYPRLARTITVVVVLFFCPAVFFLLILKLSGLRQLSQSSFYITTALHWVGLILLWLYSVKIEKRPLLIWEEHRYPFSNYIKFILLLFVILYVGIAVIHLVLVAAHLNTISSRLTEMTVIFKQNKLLLVFVALTAGITEELAIRGYLQPRLELVFSNSWTAILISSVLFGLLHFGYGTIMNMIGPFFIGLVFAYFYSKYRNIKVLIVAHFLWDFLVLLLLIRSPH